MNVSTSSNPPASPSTSKSDAARDTPRRPTDAESEDKRAAFEQVLKSRSRGDDGERGQEEQKEPAEGLAGLFAGNTPFPLPSRSALNPQQPSASSTPVELTGARKAIDAALNANVPTPVTAVGETDPAAMWEVSVREPNAVEVDARIVRADRTQHDQPALTVTVGSSKVDAEVLSRHAHRLNERLRKHAVGETHVRVERDLPRDEEEQ